MEKLKTVNEARQPTPVNLFLVSQGLIRRGCAERYVSFPMTRTLLRLLILALLMLRLNNFVVAAVFSADDPRYGAGMLTVDTSTGLAWLDLPLTSGLSYQEVLAATQPGGAFAGFRYASAQEVFAFFDAANLPKQGWYSESSSAAQPILSFISLVGATSSQDGRQETLGRTGTPGDLEAHIGVGLDFAYQNGVPGYLRDGASGWPSGGSLGDSYNSGSWGSWLIEPIPEPTSLELGVLAGLLLLCRHRINKRHNYLLETNRRPATAPSAERQFGQMVHGQAGVSSGGRSALRSPSSSK